MKVHIFQHTVDTPPGTTEAWLKKNNLNYSTTRFYENTFAIPNLSDVDFLIVCGGEMNVDEESKYSWMRAEKQFIKDAIESNKKVLGLCLGGQLIAEILGARVGRHTDWEVGWHPVEINKSSKINVPPPSNPFMVFQFHGYSFDTPPGAESLASSKACTHQGFVFGKNVVGLQFHPESTQEWVRQCSEEKLPIGKYVQTKQQMLDGNQYQPLLQDWYFKLLNYFL